MEDGSSLVLEFREENKPGDGSISLVAIALSFWMSTLVVSGAGSVIVVMLR